VLESVLAVGRSLRLVGKAEVGLDRLSAEDKALAFFD
jgi:hypothetical protein